MKEMESSNYKSLATQFIAKALEFGWLPLFLLKWLPLQPSMHSLKIATKILELASTDNLECRIAPVSQPNQILLSNQDFATTIGNLIVSERTLKYLWQEWKYLIFAVDSKSRKEGVETLISLRTEMLAINRLLRKTYEINMN